MKRNFSTLVLLLLLVCSAYSQKISFEIRENPNQLLFEIDTIDRNEFETAISTLTKENVIPISMFSEDYFESQYPTIFHKANRCYEFNGVLDFKFAK